jgi:hypothetical protein
MEQMIANGSEGMVSVFAGLFNLAIQVGHDRVLGEAPTQGNPTLRND